MSQTVAPSIAWTDLPVDKLLNYSVMGAWLNEETKEMDSTCDSTSSLPESRATTPEMRQQNQNTLDCVYTSDCCV